MRVLFFGPYPLPGQPIMGGVMAVVHALVQGMARRGIEVGVASARAGGQDRVLQDGPITLYRLGIPRLPRSRGHKIIRRKLLQAAQDFQPTLIHAHGTGYYAAAALDGLWPTILTAHAVVYEEARRSVQGWALKNRLAWWYDAWMEKRVLARAQHIIAISPYIRHAFAQYPHLRWYDIPNPVDDVFFQVQRQPQPGRLLIPARVIPRKGIDVLLQAFQSIARQFPQAQLRIAGETTSMPDYVQRCQAMVEAAGLSSRVHFLGNLTQAALLEEYALAHIMVLPSRQETAPVTIGEAMATGCPVIATRVGGTPWMVESGGNGLLVPAEDAEALAQALAYTLNHEDDVKRWGQHAREAAQAYRLDAVVDATLQVYARLTSVRDQGEVE